MSDDPDDLDRRCRLHARRAHPDSVVCPDPDWCLLYYGECFRRVERSEP